MKHLICLGDSITDCGRIFDNPPFGSGYVQLLKERLTALNKNISVINCGVDGFTVSRLLTTAGNLSVPFKDSVVTILIGINDIGLMMNTRRTEVQKKEMLIAFMHNYDKLLAFLCKNSAKVILMEPFVFPYPQEYSLWLPYLCSMSQSIRALAEKYDIPYVLLHNDLNSLATSQGFSSVTTDGIHLTLQGHQILADKLLPTVSRFFS